MTMVRCATEASICYGMLKDTEHIFWLKNRQLLLTHAKVGFLCVVPRKFCSQGILFETRIWLKKLFSSLVITYDMRNVLERKIWCGDSRFVNPKTGWVSPTTSEGPFWINIWPILAIFTKFLKIPTSKFLKIFSKLFWIEKFWGDGFVARRSIVFQDIFSKRVRLLLWMQTSLFKNKTGLFISQYYPYAKNSKSLKDLWSLLSLGAR